MGARMHGSFRQLLHPYYIVNVILSLLYVVSKTFPFVCDFLYSNCSIDFQEYELLIFLAAFVTMRNKRHFAVPDYVAHFCMFAKLCNLFMFWRQSVTYATIYGLLWLMQSYFLFQPAYNGPEAVLYFRSSTFSEVVERGDPRVTWIITFYVAWSPACNALAPIFSELSNTYGGLSGLRFGKVDVTRCPALATQYGIDASTWSNQLPTILVLRGGREVDRRPGLSAKSKKVVKFVFSWDNIVASLGLNDLYESCKAQDAQVKRSQEGLKKGEEVAEDGEEKKKTK